jgi:hypothetical protein
MENKLMMPLIDKTQTVCYLISMYRGECNITHGGSKTRLYRIWKQMRIRCNCKTNPTYRFYGDRGIKITHEWDDFAVFRGWALANGYDDTMSIDRIDVNGDYCPGNCRWVPLIEQAKNTRQSKTYIFGGLSLTHNDWARKMGISPATLTERIARHGVEEALSMKKRGKIG